MIKGMNKIQILRIEVCTMKKLKSMISKIIQFFECQSNFELSAEMKADIIYAERRYDYECKCRQ